MYYVDLAVHRGRIYLQRLAFTSYETAYTSFSSLSSSHINFPKLHDGVKNAMFFCWLRFCYFTENDLLEMGLYMLRMARQWIFWLIVAKNRWEISSCCWSRKCSALSSFTKLIESFCFESWKDVPVTFSIQAGHDVSFHITWNPFDGVPAKPMDITWIAEQKDTWPSILSVIL